MKRVKCDTSFTTFDQFINRQMILLKYWSMFHFLLISFIVITPKNHWLKIARCLLLLKDFCVVFFSIYRLPPLPSLFHCFSHCLLSFYNVSHIITASFLILCLPLFHELTFPHWFSLFIKKNKNFYFSILRATSLKKFLRWALY